MAEISDKKVDAKIEEKLVEQEADKRIATGDTKTDAEAKADAKKAEAKAKNPKPKQYTADRAVYVDGRLYAVGEVFTTADEPADFWTEAEPEEVAAIEAASKAVHVQPSLEELSVSELRSLAATKDVQTTVAGKALGKADLITAIKAVDEPRL